jgi:aminopeptidase
MLKWTISNTISHVPRQSAVIKRANRHPKFPKFPNLSRSSIVGSHSSRNTIHYRTLDGTFFNQSLTKQKSKWRSYCDDAMEGNENLQNETLLAPAEPLQWSTSSILPNLLSSSALKGIDRGLNVKELLETAKMKIRTTLAYSFHMGPDAKTDPYKSEKILVVYDTHCLLSRILAQAYGLALDSKNTLMVDFDATTVGQLKATIDTMKEGDMVVLVQSNGFRLNDYRLRIELFKVGIKNLEHSHLDMMPNSQISTYIDTLSFVPSKENLNLAHGLKQLMDTQEKFIVRSKGGVECVYECGLEPALLNVGDYTGMKGVGGTFPVGEVFSEPKDFDRVNGEFMVFGYPNKQFDMQHLCQPFKITICKGQLVKAENAPKSFVDILDAIRGQEGEEGGGILIREFGVGINTAIGRNAPLQNVTAFERQAGFHISLGRKHTVFKKSGISHKRSRFHIDVFIDLDQIQMGDKVVYTNGRFQL